MCSLGPVGDTVALASLHLPTANVPLLIPRRVDSMHICLVFIEIHLEKGTLYKHSGPPTCIIVLHTTIPISSMWNLVGWDFPPNSFIWHEGLIQCSCSASVAAGAPCLRCYFIAGINMLSWRHEKHAVLFPCFYEVHVYIAVPVSLWTYCIFMFYVVMYNTLVHDERRFLPAILSNVVVLLLLDVVSILLDN